MELLGLKDVDFKCLSSLLSDTVRDVCILYTQYITKVLLLSFSKATASYCPWWKSLGKYCPQRTRNIVPIAGTVKWAVNRLK